MIEADLSDARIRFDSNVRGPEDSGIFLFSFDAKEVSTWFELDFDFAENRKDFWVTIRNFGLLTKTFAGSKTLDVLRKFSAPEKELIARRIENYFMGPEEKNLLLLTIGPGRILGVRFLNNWIAEK